AVAHRREGRAERRLPGRDRAGGERRRQAAAARQQRHAARGARRGCRDARIRQWRTNENHPGARASLKACTTPVVVQTFRSAVRGGRMTRRICLVIGALIAAAYAVHAQQPRADLILTNGKIVTVDDRFTIAQAVAVAGDRVVATGTNDEITRLAA